MAESASGQPAENKNLKVEDITVTEPGVVRRAIGASAIGNVTEWYDFGVYAYLEPTIEKVFFDDLGDPWKTIATLGLFAVAFLVRPFGGLFFGPLADRIGRKNVLSLTMILMALGTFAIGIIPSVESIGLFAPALLLLARLIQGFSTGGEYGNAMTFIAEYSPDRKRGFLGSWLEFGTLTGYFMGAIVVTSLSAVLTEQQLLDWGWRIPFFVALPLGLVGLYLRLRLEETPAFTAMEKATEDRERDQRQTGGEMKSIFVTYARSMLVCVGLVLVFNVTNYMLTAYMPTYLTSTLPKLQGGGVSETTSQLLQIFVLAALMVVITFLGRWSDRIGRRPIVLAGCVALVVLSFPAIALIRADNSVSVFFGLLIMGLTLICFSSTMPSTLPALFPTHIRAGGLSIAFNVSVSAFGGTTAVVMSSLVGATGNLDWPAYYLIAAGVIGAIALYFTEESANQSLPGSPPAVNTEEEARELVGAAK